MSKPQNCDRVTRCPVTSPVKNALEDALTARAEFIRLLARCIARQHILQSSRQPTPCTPATSKILSDDSLKIKGESEVAGDATRGVDPQPPKV